MIRQNETFHPSSSEVAPNGFYQAYKRFFDEVFIQEEFESDLLKNLYVFDRHTFATPKFTPGQGWQPIEILQDPMLEGQFNMEEQLGEYEKELLSFLLIKSRSKLLKIVGDVGTGKSKFLQYMFTVFLPKQRFFENVVYVPFDLKRVFQEREEYTYEQTIELIEQHFSKIFKKHAVVSNGEGLSCPEMFSDILEFLEQLVRSRGPNKVIISFDNVDPFAPGFQNHLWEVSQQLAACTGGTVILCMRDINSRHFETIGNAGAIVYLQMDQRPPVISKVAQRRLLYFIEKDSRIEDYRIIRIKNKDISVTLDDLKEFVGKFLSILQDDKIANALQNMSNFNVRVALIWILRFLKSWNLNVVLMVEKFAKVIDLKLQAEPIVTLDSLINAMGFWNHSMYFPTCSSLENVFSAHLKESNADLLIKARCLKYCDVHGESVNKNDLTTHLRKFGYSESEIKEAVEQLLAHPRRLLTSSDGGSFEDLHTIKLNFAGKFYLDKLLSYLDYLQLVAVDCYLPEELVPRLNQDSTITDRISSTIKIVEFIGERELEEISSGEKKMGAAFIDEYKRIYGEELLASRILRKAKSFICHLLEGRFSTRLRDKSFHEILREIDSINERLSQKRQILFQKS